MKTTTLRLLKNPLIAPVKITPLNSALRSRTRIVINYCCHDRSISEPAAIKIIWLRVRARYYCWRAKIRPFLTEHAAQILVQALVVSRLDYCNALLAGLPSNTIKPLQMIQNAAARLVFNEPKRTHVTPLFISLHWLPVAARIKFKTLMLAYRTTTGSAPSNFHSLLRIYIPSRSLRSASERRLVVPSQRGSKSLSRAFSFTILYGGIIFPPPSGMLDPCQSSSNN